MFGICGGMQLLGRELCDPEGLEGGLHRTVPTATQVWVSYRFAPYSAETKRFDSETAKPNGPQEAAHSVWKDLNCTMAGRQLSYPVSPFAVIRTLAGCSQWMIEEDW